MTTVPTTNQQSTVKPSVVSELSIVRPNKFHIEISLEDFLTMMFYIKNQELEISGFGLVYERINQDKRWLEVKKIFLLTQECSQTETEIDEETHFKFIRTNERYIHRTKLWWHSHAKMPVFWSSIDEKNIVILRNNSYLLSIVGNHAHDVLARIDMFHPVPYSINGVPIYVNCEKMSDAKIKNILLDSFRKNGIVTAKDFLFNYDLLTNKDDLLNEIKEKVSKKAYANSKKVSNEIATTSAPMTGQQIFCPADGLVFETAQDAEEWLFANEWITRKNVITSPSLIVAEPDDSTEIIEKGESLYVNHWVKEELIKFVLTYFQDTAYHQIFQQMISSRANIFKVLNKKYNNGLSNFIQEVNANGLRRPICVSKEWRDAYVSEIINTYCTGIDTIFGDLEIIWIDSLIQSSGNDEKIEELLTSTDRPEKIYQANSIVVPKIVHDTTMFFIDILTLMYRGDINFGTGLDLIQAVLEYQSQFGWININDEMYYDLTGEKLDDYTGVEDNIECVTIENKKDIESDTEIICIDDDTENVNVINLMPPLKKKPKTKK